MPEKINHKAVEWFLKSELPELREKGVVPEESLDALERYYSELAQRPNNALRIVTIILFCIGALLVMLGISLIIAHNWNDFPDSIRLAMGYMPPAAGALLGFFTLWKKKRAAWREPVSIVYGAGIATAIAGTSQVYYMGGELSSFMFVWLCLLIPVPFVFRSFGSLILTMAVAVFWNCCDYNHPQLWLHVLLPLIPGAMLISLMFRKAESCIGCWCRYLLVPYAFLFCVPFFMQSGQMASMSLWLAVTGAMCILGWRIDSDHPFGFFRNPLPGAGFAGCYFVLMSCCHQLVVLRRTQMVFDPAVHLPCYAAMLLPLATVLYCTLKKPRNWLCLLVLLPAAALLTSYCFNVSGIVMSCVTLVLMILLFILGTKRNSLTCLNAGMLLVVGLAFVWFMESCIDILTRGFLFIIIGLLFAGVNILILHHRKKGGSSHA